MSQHARNNPDQCAAEETAKRLNSAPTFSDIDREEQARQLSEVTDMDVIDEMSHIGGSFVKGLATAMRYADPVNRQKLKAAFPEYWAEYTEKARWQKEEE